MTIRPPLLISGTPGAGKSTLAKALAARRARAVLIETDVFFDFVCDIIDPSTPAAREQNEAIVAAYCGAASAFVAGGYEVILEGVLGPWLFPLVHRDFKSFDYLLLHASREAVMQRVVDRDGDEAGMRGIVDRMYPQFEGILDEFGINLLVTEHLEPGQVVAEAEKMLATGQCRILMGEAGKTPQGSG